MAVEVQGGITIGPGIIIGNVFAVPAFFATQDLEDRFITNEAPPNDLVTEYFNPQG
jgi:hypothetical protein